MSHKKILLITYQYYPLTTPRSFRWHAIAKELSKNEYQVDVVCCAFHNLPYFEKIEKIQIHRVKPWFFKTLYRKNIAQMAEAQDLFQITKEKEDQNTSNFLHTEKPKFLKNIINLLISIFSRIYHFFWWPDFGMFWIPPTIKFCRKLIQDNDYDRVIAVSWPVSGHVVGYFLQKNLLLRNIPLIVDVGDPFALNEFSLSNNRKLYKSLNRLFEKKLFSHATGISVTNQAIKDLYIKKYMINHQKIKVIPPIFDMTILLDTTKPLNAISQENIKLLYIGSLRKGNRSPTILLKLFSDLWDQNENKNLELHLLGDHSEFKEEISEFEKKYKGNVFSYGLVTRQTAFAATIQADFLINIGNKSAYQVPSKLVDYMYACKPIINIQQISQDSSYQFLEKYPLLTNLDFSHQDYKTNLEKFTQLVKSDPESISQDTIKDILQEFNVEKISSIYLSNWWL